MSRITCALLAPLIPRAEREEFFADLDCEFRGREIQGGRAAAVRWLARQCITSLPVLIRRSYWRGRTGFEPAANRLQPGGGGMETVIMDVRYAVRRLLSRPGYAALAILTLALGVGGTAAIYRMLRGVLLEPLPYRDESQLVMFWDGGSWSEAEFLAIKPHTSGFANLSAYRAADVTLELDRGPTQLVHRVIASAELFRTLGASAAIGRAFQPGDDTESADLTVVLSDALWRQLGGSRDILGKRLRMGGYDRTVIGVMPRNFWFPDPSIQAWTTARFSPESRAGNYALVGRLPVGKQVAGMTAPLAEITRVLRENFKYSEQWDRTRAPVLTPIRTSLLGPMRPALVATVSAISLILLIACANVASLMLGQVDSRSGELAVRAALGANRHRLVQQLIAEAMIVGIAAGICGGLIAVGGFRVLLNSLPVGAWAANAHLDWSLLIVAVLIALVAAVGISVVPTIALWRGDVRGSLTRLRTTGVRGRGGRLEAGLVITEVALAVTMAAGAALLIRSVAHLYRIDPGVRTERIGVIDITAPGQMPAAERRQAIHAALAALQSVPGVRSVGGAQKIPLRGSGDNWGVRIEGQTTDGGRTTSFRVVTPGYLEILGTPVVTGRSFTTADREGSERVVVINQSFARQYFPGQDPLGKRLSTFGDTVYERVVGVIADVAEGSLTDSAGAARYMLLDQIPYYPLNYSLLLSTAAVDPVTVFRSARTAIQGAAPRLAVREMTTMQHTLQVAIGPARQIMTLLAMLASLAMLLGAIGVYGVVSHFVHQRRRDWSIRIALGQPPLDVMRQVVVRGTRLVLVGAIVGVVITIVSARVLTALLYGVQAIDPASLIVAMLALLITGVIAAFIPALRASRVAPASVLKES